MASVGKYCETAIDMALQQLEKEARLVVNFSEDFEWLNDQLTYLRGFLIDAGEQSKHENEAVRKWLHKIQEIAMQSEDIVEECAVESIYNDRITSCGLSWNQIFFDHMMGRKIKDVKDRMSSIIKEGELLQIARDVLATEQASSSTLQRPEWKKSTLLPIDSHPVGIESKVQYIISLLDNPALPILAVVGMGGLGKTYLLQHVYDKIKGRFEISIWLSISQSYSICNLQREIAFHDSDLKKQIVEGNVTSEQLAAQLINAKLKEKNCLIVLDDVWKPITEDNLMERLGLTLGRHCKIVITTRNKEVCRNVHAEIYNMEQLSEEESWKLFCAYSFPNCVENRPPHELEEVAHKVLRECGHLPLAIKTTAASVAGIALPREWEIRLRQLKQVSALNNPMEILKLSYDCLPARLKPCFAYFSFFPEDEKIECEYLVNLWMGEGFIPEEKDQSDIAWSYLNEMANLCLCEVWEELEVLYYKLKKYCRVHDLFHDLAIYISKENKCAFDAEDAFTKGPSRETSGRGWNRILLPKKSMGNDVMAHSRLAGSPTLLRTLSLCNNELESIPANIFVNMRALRVLDLSWNTRLRKLPDCVGEMKLLKVLNLAGTGIEEVPRCVRRLKSLRYLDVSKCPALPMWIGEVKCLEYIKVGSVSKMPKGISKLSSLRILRSAIPLILPVEDGQWLDLKDVGSMIELQEVGISVNDESEWRSIEGGGILSHLVNMRHFTMRNYGHMDVPLFPENLKGMADLERLRLEKFAVRSSSLCSFANLRELFLWKCEWSDYPEFEKMGNLVSLYMYRNAPCRELPKAFGKASGFPKLRFLTIDGFSELEEFPELEEGAMPCLEVFDLQSCPRLKNVPEGLELLKRLKEFNFMGTGTEEVRERLKKEGGQDWHKIKAHNPHLIIDGGEE